MKTAFLNTFLCLSLMILASACGKSGGGGGGNNNSYQENLTNPGLSQNSQVVLNKVAAWYASNVEGGAIVGTKIVSKIQKTYNTSPTCVEKKFLGIPYQYCTVDTSASNTVTLSSTTMYLTQDGQTISARTNAELAKVFSGSIGTLISAVDTSYTASQLDFLRADGTVVRYVIDRQYHSLLNPITKSEVSQTSRVDTLTQVQNFNM